jgi:PKD repeat protein
VANAGANQTANAGTTLTFNGSGSVARDGCTISSYSWAFGDLGTATGASVTHAYASAGTYAVTLTVTDNWGATGQGSCTVTITNLNNPPSGPWAVRFGGTGTDGGHEVAVDRSGNIFAAGWFSTNATFGGTTLSSAGGMDVFLTKSSSSGSLLWARRYGGTGDETVTSMALDANGNIFLGGYFSGTANLGGANMTSAAQNDIFLAKYDSAGNHLWSEHFGGTNNDILNGLAVDSQGNVVITGTYSKSVSFGGSTFNSIYGGDTGFVAKYSSSGAYMWSMSLAGGNANYPTGVAVDKNDNTLVTGYFYSWINLGGGQLTAGGPSNPNIFIGKFTSGGAYVWSKAYTSTYSQRALAIAVDANADVAISGDFTTQANVGGGTILGTGYYNDLFVAKYSGVDGSYQWAKPVVGQWAAEPTCVAADAQNNILVTGYYYGTLNFGTQSVTSLGTSYNVLVGKYSSSGGLLKAQSLGGTLTSEGFGVAVDSSGYAVLTGAFSGSGSFGSQTLTSAGSYDAFLARLSP